jgi:hypothetical protein
VKNSQKRSEGLRLRQEQRRRPGTVPVAQKLSACSGTTY